MRRVLVLTEGQTERTFVRDVLAGHLQKFGITPVSTVISTRRVKSGPDFKGGVQSFGQFERDAKRLLRDTDAAITTMIDSYGLPLDFPGMSTREAFGGPAAVEHVSSCLAEHFGDARFLPYLWCHEFEALLFTSPADADWVFDYHMDVIATLEEIAGRFASPEEINDGAETAPSKRVARAFPGYSKLLHGPMAVASIGLEPIRRACPRFGAWVGRLERLALVPG